MTNQSPKPPDLCDRSEITRALSILFEPGDVVELRIPKAGKYRTISGYFDDLDAMAQDAAKWSGRVPGVYVTLNAVDPALLARSCNRAQAYAELTTQDNQITRRRWLLIDADAERPAGISSTDAEHTAALSHVVAIRDTRSAQGWPLPVLADSGNGGHLLYRIDEPADDNGLIQRVLKAFAFYHDTAAIHIDQTVFNAARICKLYGTQAAKGDPTPERPHRIARIIEAPSTIAPVPHELLQALADSIPTDDGAKRTAFASQGADFDLEGWIKQYLPEARAPSDWNGGKRWILPECPWRAEDGDSAYVVRLRSGGIAAGCQHATCPGSRATGNHWKELRARFEPGYQDRQSRAHSAAPVTTDESGRPEVVLSNTQQRDRMALYEDVLLQANNPPFLFVRSGALVCVRPDEKDRPVIVTVTKEILGNMLCGHASFVKVRSLLDINGNPFEKRTPTEPTQRDLSEYLARDRWPFPALQAIVEAPTLRPDGTIITKPGYDAATELYYHPDPALSLPAIPEQPTPQQVQASIGLLQEAIKDFPFALDAKGRDSSRANALGMLIAPIVRPAIPGHVLAGAIDAPQQGAGKGLLCNLSATMATGRPASMMNAPRSEEEMAKTLTSLLVAGSTFIVIDNLAGTFDSAQLATFLTADTWKQRLLGGNEMVEVAQRASVYLNGNNLSLGGDLPRRAYWIRLDPKMARPWQRTGFTHDDLIGWATEHRGELLVAVLTLARAWYAAGKPAGNVPAMGTFSPWAQTIGGILELAGDTDFLANADEMYDRLDAETDQWQSFLAAWYDLLGEQDLKVSELLPRIQAPQKDAATGIMQGGDLYYDLPDAILQAVSGDNPNVRAIGTAFRDRDGRVYPNGYRIECAGADSHSKSKKWRVVNTADSEEFAGSAGSAGSAATPPIKKDGVQQQLQNDIFNGAGTHPAHPAHPANAGPLGLPESEPQTRGGMATDAQGNGANGNGASKREAAPELADDETEGRF